MIRFDLLNQSANPANAFVSGLQTGRAIKQEMGRDNALAAFARDPGNPETVNALLAYDPRAAVALDDFQRGRTFRKSASQYLGKGDAQAREAAFGEMAAADPGAAVQIRGREADAQAEQLRTLRSAYEFGISALSNVSDDQSYQAARGRFIEMLQPLGIDPGALASVVPEAWPGPDGTRALLMSALNARDQLAAMDRRDRAEGYLDNLAADNERADRNTDSLIADRSARRDLARRGQDMASADRRRGQDITDSRVREAGTRQGRRGRGQAVVDVQTPEQARALQPGTVFRTPDGRVKVR